MRTLPRPALLLLASLLVFFLSPAAAGASHLRGAMIWWCPNGQSFNPEIRFLIEVFYHGNSQPESSMAGFKPGEERTLDVGSAIVAGASSTFTLTAQGQPGGSAVVMIWDGGTP